ncbi:MAG: hypothetical protein M1820_003006 [Bogoriella megaspora]|nr:MAG: hypothetical protein M1820_003006 [Bogoriella megaspora]
MAGVYFEGHDTEMLPHNASNSGSAGFPIQSDAHSRYPPVQNAPSLLATQQDSTSITTHQRTEFPTEIIRSTLPPTNDSWHKFGPTNPGTSSSSSGSSSSLQSHYDSDEDREPFGREYYLAYEPPRHTANKEWHDARRDVLIRMNMMRQPWTIDRYKRCGIARYNIPAAQRWSCENDRSCLQVARPGGEVHKERIFVVRYGVRDCPVQHWTKTRLCTACLNEKRTPRGRLDDTYAIQFRRGLHAYMLGTPPPDAIMTEDGQPSTRRQIDAARRENSGHRAVNGASSGQQPSQTRSSNRYRVKPKRLAEELSEEAERKRRRSGL